MSGYPHPKITVGGVELNPAHATTIWVALNGLHSDMSELDALGKDEHGRAMQRLYKQRIVEIQEIWLTQMGLGTTPKGG